MPVQALAHVDRRAAESRRESTASSTGKAERFAGCRVLVVPGLFGSGPDHWQSDWQRRHPQFGRVEQDDWSWPNLERWARRVVESAIDANEPVVLVAHSFGCLASIRASVFQSNLIAGALLVAPADPARFNLEDRLPRATVDFPTVVVASDNDPWMPLERSRLWAQRWGSGFVRLDGAGHINTKSGHSEWPLGLELLEQLCGAASLRPRKPFELLH